MAKLKKDYLIQKRNVLNEIRANNMTLQELRFFSIYLSKIHKDKPDETRVVRFPMEDFKAIMELGRIDINYMKNVTNSLLCKVVNVPCERGGYIGFQLFKECVVSNDGDGEWYVEIDAHDKALPLMFEFKNRYFSYKLWNALRLRSPNQLRMYEILKQYETVGERILNLADLRSMMGIGKDEYHLYADFRKWVLVPCQKALAEHTDIKYTFESIRGKGKGGKIQSLKFIITENKDYMDQITLDMYIEESKLKDEVFDDVIDDENIEVDERHNDRIEFFMEACNNEFSFDEVVYLNDQMRTIISSKEFSDQLHCYHHLNRRYQYMNLQDKHSKIDKRFGYMKSIMDKEV
jgi:plasmid replication initiation protein